MCFGGVVKVLVVRWELLNYTHFLLHDHWFHKAAVSFVFLLDNSRFPVFLSLLSSPSQPSFPTYLSSSHLHYSPLSSSPSSFLIFNSLFVTCLLLSLPLSLPSSQPFLLPTFPYPNPRLYEQSLSPCVINFLFPSFPLSLIPLLSLPAPFFRV